MSDTMFRELGVGIIGVGTIGRFHLEAAMRLGARVVAVVTRSAFRAKAVSEEFGVAVWSDYRRLLDDPAVGVVHVCTPDYLHYPMARDALLAGKHVICEKPLTLTSTESADLLTLAESAGLVHAVDFNNRFYPLIWEARARVARGDLGRVFAVRGFILEDSLLDDTVYDWRLDPRQGAKSVALSTIGSHLVDLLQFVVGAPIVAVCADITTVHPRRWRPSPPQTPEDKFSSQGELIDVPGEEIACLLVRFASGVKGVLGVSRASAGRRYQITVQVDGTAAALAWNSESPNQLWIGHNDRANEILLRDPSLLSAEARRQTGYHGAYQEAFADSLKQLVRAVYDRIVRGSQGAPGFPTFADGHAALVVHETALESSQRRCWIDVSATPGDMQAR